jgi:mRNA interferase RelE/StbE
MKKWKITLQRKAAKQLQKLPKAIQDIAFELMEDLEAEGPIPKHCDVKKTGDNENRVRINYRYRMRYKVKQKELIIEVFYIGHRKEAYQ